jgi:hypothetical protein
LLTYAQSVTWSSPSDGLFYLNTFGVLLQVLAYALILRSLIPVLVQTLSKVAVFPGWLVKLAIACLVAKVLVQSAVALPFVAVISYTIRLYVIGFIHLILLGMVTLSMGGVLQLHHILPSGRLTKTGWILLLFGFLLTEMLLFTQGTLIWAGFGFLPNYHYAIFICSLLFPAGISMILTGALLNKTSNHNSFNFNNQVKQ